MIKHLKEKIILASGETERKTLKFFPSRSLMLGHVISMIYWLLWLKDTESGYSVYLLVGVSGIVAYFSNKKKYIENTVAVKFIICLCSLLFSVMIVAANYIIISNMSGPEGRTTVVDYFCIFAIIILVICGGFCLACNLLSYIIWFLSEKGWQEKEHKIKPHFVVAATMVIISALNLWVLFFCYRPGILTPDSIWQIEQCVANVYSNHHPFYHTVIIKLILGIGLWMFHDISGAVMLYSIFQIILMSGIFSFVIVTLYQMGLSWKGVSICLAWYLFMPFNIMYSFTMWKDVLFGGAVAVFLTSVYRTIRGIGSNEFLNYVMVFGAGAGICLLRSNGWFVFWLTFLCFVILFRKEQSILAGVLLGVMIFSYLLLHPVLDCLNVDRTDLIEALSIPAQQIARVITDCNDITQEQKDLLDQIVDTERIPEVYLPYISDPIKQEVRQTNRQNYLVDHRMEYVRLWIELGVGHPYKYIEAWVDLTKGYWGGGRART